MSRARVTAAALLLALVALLFGGAPALAAEEPCNESEVTATCDENDVKGQEECKIAPEVESPRSGVAGSLLGARVAPQSGEDPSMYERYGFAGLKWDTYNLGWTPPLVGGCVPNPDSIDASWGQQISNGMFDAAKWITAVGDSMIVSAYNIEWLGAFDPFVTEAVGSLREKIFNGWVPLACSVLGLILLWRARSAAFASAASIVGAALLVAVSAVLLFTMPLAAANAYDRTLTGMTSDVAAAINGSSPNADPASGANNARADHAMIASVHEALLFQTWVQGQFGSADSPAAKKYAKDLFDAQALTWDEAQQVEAGGSAATALVNKKKAKYIEVVTKIETEDPIAYSHIQGKFGNERIGWALLALLGTLLSMPVIIMGCLAMMCAYLIVRMVIVIAPVVAPLALVRNSIGMDMVDRVVSIAMTALVWSIGIPVVMALNRAAMVAPDLHPVLRLVLLLVIAVASFFTLMGLAPGFGGVLSKRHAKRGMRLSGKALSFIGAWLGARKGSGDHDHPQPERPVDGTIDDDPYGPYYEADRDDEIDGEVWESGEPVEANRRRALGQAPLTPDYVYKTSDAAERGLPTQRREPEPVEDDEALHEGSVRVEDDGSEVYDIYSGTTREDWDRKEAGGDGSTDDDASSRAAGGQGMSRWLIPGYSGREGSKGDDE